MAETPEYLAAGGVLTIDLGAIRANYRALRARLGGVACAAVVKADAYGLGVAAVAPVLAAAGCRQFFVAHLQEAVALRPLVPADGEIFVLNGLPDGTECQCAALGAVPVLNSLGQIQAWQALCRDLARPLPAALQVDTGMARLGLSAGEWARLAAEQQRLDGIDLVLVMSHLACAEQQDSPMNAAQLARFRAACAMRPGTRRSLANSSGIFLGPDYHFDLARPGVALYGVAPVAGAGENPMRPVVRLQGRVVQVREIAAGDTVGYGASFRAAGASRIATVAVGYADGFLRSLSNRAVAFAGAVAVPLVGRVSMDSTTFDVSALPDGAVRPGQFLDLIGPHNPPEALAEAAGTIPYEILTGLGRRYARRYVDDTPAGGGDAP